MVYSSAPPPRSSPRRYPSRFLPTPGTLGMYMTDFNKTVNPILCCVHHGMSGRGQKRRFPEGSQKVLGRLPEAIPEAMPTVSWPCLALPRPCLALPCPAPCCWGLRVALPSIGNTNLAMRCLAQDPGRSQKIPGSDTGSNLSCMHTP